MDTCKNLTPTKNIANFREFDPGHCFLEMPSENVGNIFGELLRKVLVWLLENHVIRFIVTLLMSFVYDTYSYGMWYLIISVFVFK